MTVQDATREYEDWLRADLLPLHIVESDLDHKHREMADRRDPFPFFRGTYYLWAKRWATHAGPLADAPRVLGIGDAHLENLGTWRDADGRLCWGVNDFDETDEVPFTLDLVRLATSVRFARSGGAVTLKLPAVCELLLQGYRKALDAGGVPFVLEERHRQLRAIAMADERAPKVFWDDQLELLNLPPADLPDDAREALVKLLPPDARTPDYRPRLKAGVGSLGRPRFVALTDWAGGMICRETKAAAPPATAWAWGSDSPNRAALTVSRARRSPDPFYHPAEQWVTRRLAPRSQRIDRALFLERVRAGLFKKVSVKRVIRAMGAEVANVHLGTPDAADLIRPHLDRLPADWLASAACSFATVIDADWKEWRENRTT